MAKRAFALLSSLLLISLLATGCSDRALVTPPQAHVPASAGSGLAITEERPGVLTAWHAAMRLRTTFERGRVAVLPAASGDGAGAALELAAVAWGCTGEMTAVTAALPVLSTDAATEVGFSHPGFDEWYRLGQAGLEQGFTMRELPECVSRGERLRIRLRYSEGDGATAQIAEGGDQALLSAPGSRRVHYGALSARDALGVALALRIVDERALSLEIDATNAVLPLTIDPLVWDLQELIQAKDFVPPSFRALDFFGNAVSVFGDTALIAAYGDSDKGEDAGAAYVFTRVPAVEARVGPRWEPQQKLTALDAQPGDHFGGSVALSGETALIGAYADDAPAGDAGSAYVFVRSGTTWTQQQRLLPSDSSANARFGSSVALSGDTAIIGAALQSAGSLSEVGAAYVFSRTGTSWTQQAKLTPPVAALRAGLHFGAAVAMAGASVAIGRDDLTAGGVDWFTKSGPSWVASGVGVSSNVAHFGSALAMTESRTVIGAPGDGAKGAQAGSVSVASTSPPHSPLLRLTASDARPRAQFGYAVALSDEILLVGAPGLSFQIPSCTPDLGGVYAFVPSGEAWTEQQRLTSFGYKPGAPPAACDPKDASSVFGAEVRLGTSVATAGNVVLMGEPYVGEVPAIGMPHKGAVLEEEYLLTLASPCTQGGDCFSGYCVEGVCCKSACEGACRSCLAALKDPANSFNGDWVTGVCGEVRANTDPKNGCTDEGTFCGTGDDCSGFGGCEAAHPFGTPCGNQGAACATPTSASSNNICLSYVCTSTFSVACQTGYACTSGVCNTQCQADAQCDTSLGFDCVHGLCVWDPGASSDGGSAGEGGGAGASGSADDAGSAGQGESTGEAGSAGAGGSASSGSVGGGGARAGAGQVGEGGDGVTGAPAECEPACTAGMVCNRSTAACEDILVTACGCRAAGGDPSTPLPHSALLALAALIVLRRRQRD